MTIGVAFVVVVLGLAFGAVAVRRRDFFWLVVSVGILVLTATRISRFGLELALFETTFDQWLIVIGVLILAVTVVLTMLVPRSIQDRWLYGLESDVAHFERSFMKARQPFFEAAATKDASVTEKARWRDRIGVEAPNDEWAALADRVAASDQAWAAGVVSTGEAPFGWELANEKLLADWEALRQRDLGSSLRRARLAAALGWVGYLVAFVMIVVGGLNVTTGLLSGPPEGRAAEVPVAPPGRTVHLAPLGDFPSSQLRELADFYAERYGLQVHVLPPTLIPGPARDTARNQVVAEGVIEGLRAAYPEAGDPARVIIAVTSEDLRIRGRPDWVWAFGLRTEGHLAVLSTARMGPVPGPFGDRLEAARLRKMVTKYIGALYYGLPESADPRSVIYGPILGVRDLDAMGEDY